MTLNKFWHKSTKGTMFCFQICSHHETKRKGAFLRDFFCCNATGNWSNLNQRHSCKTSSQMGVFTLFLPERFSVIIVGRAVALFGVFQGQREEIKHRCALEADPVKTFCIFPRIAASLSRPCNAAPEAGGVCFCPTEDRYTLDHSYTVKAFSYWPKKTDFDCSCHDSPQLVSSLWRPTGVGTGPEQDQWGSRTWWSLSTLPESFYWHPALIGPLLDPLRFAFQANRAVGDGLITGLHYILQHRDSGPRASLGTWSSTIIHQELT